MRVHADPPASLARTVGAGARGGAGGVGAARPARPARSRQPRPTRRCERARARAPRRGGLRDAGSVGRRRRVHRSLESRLASAARRRARRAAALVGDRHAAVRRSGAARRGDRGSGSGARAPDADGWWSGESLRPADATPKAPALLHLYAPAGCGSRTAADGRAPALRGARHQRPARRSARVLDLSRRARPEAAATDRRSARSRRPACTRLPRSASRRPRPRRQRGRAARSCASSAWSASVVATSAPRPRARRRYRAARRPIWRA